MCVRIRSFCKYITKWTCHCLALLLYIYIILKTQTFFNQPYMYISCNTVDTGLIITYFIRNRTISGRLTIRKTNRNTFSLKFVIHFRESYGEIRSSYRHTAPLSVLPQVQTGSVVTCMAGVSASTIQPLSNRSVAKLTFSTAFLSWEIWLHLLQSGFDWVKITPKKCWASAMSHPQQVKWHADMLTVPILMPDWATSTIMFGLF